MSDWGDALSEFMRGLLVLVKVLLALVVVLIVVVIVLIWRLVS